ncbi:electron transfer flavoprotein subunit alpha/FixB family protein [Nitrincola tibetensis]|uniref:Electron transfer flavoprotein subunit alpha n=2 Tax=Nitrincola TaxID=267849 RepID=A0A364NND0_9GAMM|nr:FAD-binding protein [Nitrincola tibetensis]RAU18520.1 electron transfer flavoprotein subunit alpha/FixB family protein [Nitrincola tibetensis]
MAILLIAEHDNSVLKPATLHALTAAQEIGGEIDILVVGVGCAAAADHASKVAGVRKVLLADNAVYDHEIAENVAALVVDVAAGYDHLIAPAVSNAKNFMPRVAALLDVGQISDVIKVESADTFQRPIYAGNAIATVQSLDTVKVLTIRATGFDAAPAEGGSAGIEVLGQVLDAGVSRLVSEEMAVSDRPELTSARVIISGGRGMGDKAHFDMLDKVADKLGAAVGATRAAVDAGFVPNDMQIGQTGKIVAPELYIGVGLSGAIQHLAGMKDSKVIVAINKDEDAPIFQVADYGLVADLFEAVPELEKAL